MLTTVAAAHWSGSSYIANASLVAALIWLGSFTIWFLNNVLLLIEEDGVWRYAVLDCFALIYFYVRWSSPEAQHRQFHFLLMWSYLATTLFYAYQFWISSFATNAFGMSPWWHQLISNILFACELLLITLYAFLFRRAKKDTAKYRSDVESWFKKADEVKKAVKGFKRGAPENRKR